MVNSSMLEKIRRINKILQQSAGQRVDFKEVAAVLKNVIQANIYITDHEGKILGFAMLDEFECDLMRDGVLSSGVFPGDYNEFLLKDESTRVNLSLESNACVFVMKEPCRFTNKITTVVPIAGGGRRLGTLVLARFNDLFEAGDLVMAETGATVVGMEILRDEVSRAAEEAREKAVAQLAVNTLSYSELEAMVRLFKELDGGQGILVTSKVADQMGITRSVIVNALSKLESAGTIETRSLGMKGTYIKVLNRHLTGCLRHH